MAVDISPEDLGTNDILKVATKYVAVGCTVSPPMVSTFLIDNREICRVKDR